MSISLINKFIFILVFFLLISSCSSTKSVYKTFKIKTYEIPSVEAIDKANILLSPANYKRLDYDNKLILKELKSNIFFNNIIIKSNQIFALSKDMKLTELNNLSGKIISSIEIEMPTMEEQILISFDYIDESFIASFKSGLIIRFNQSGKIIWKFQRKKILNSPLKFIDDQVIVLFVDEILGLNINDGLKIWSELYEDLPIYQSIGGQLVNFLNLVYFVLPNNNLGSVDVNLGLVNDSPFNEIPLITSLNNIKDKIYIYDNILVYLDEGKYLYSYNIFNNDFKLFKKSINLSSSNIFFNNSLILKQGNYIQAININNKKTFWLIDDKNIDKNSKIIGVRNIDKNIEIFLNNGDVLIINNKELIDIKSIKINNIEKIIFKKQNIIVNTVSGKTIIY